MDTISRNQWKAAASCMTLKKRQDWISQAVSGTLNVDAMDDETLLKQQPFVKLAILAPSRVNETLQWFVKCNGSSEHINDAATENFWKATRKCTLRYDQMLRKKLNEDVASTLGLPSPAWTSFMEKRFDKTNLGTDCSVKQFLDVVNNSKTVETAIEHASVWTGPLKDLSTPQRAIDNFHDSVVCQISKNGTTITNRWTGKTVTAEDSESSEGDWVVVPPSQE